MMVLRLGLGVSRLKPNWKHRVPTSHQRFFSTSGLERERNVVDIQISQNGGHVAAITLCRSRAKNALSRELMTQLRCAVETFASPERAAEAGARNARVLLIRSGAPGVFCAGADLKERLAMTVDEARNYVKWLRESMLALERLPQTTIACLNGAALGGGLEVALSCDFRVSGKEALIGLPEASLGIIPGAGGTQRLPRLIGHQKAKFLTMTARKISATEALEYGIVDFVEGVNEDRLLESNLSVQLPGGGASLAAEQITNTAHSLANKLFSPLSFPPGMASTKGEMNGADRLGLYLCDQLLRVGPVALRAAKKAMYDGIQEPDIENSMNAEAAGYEMVLPTRDRLEAMHAFSEKRKPDFEGW